MAQVFDAEETPALSAEAIAAVAEAAWEHARLQTVAGFRLLALRYPVNAYLQSVREGKHDHPSTRRKDGWVVVYRKDYAVWRLDLDRLGYGLLSDLAGGLPLGRAVGRAMRSTRRGATEEALFRSFRLWVSCGLFRSVRT